jgi:hypothetical protein
MRPVKKTIFTLNIGGYAPEITAVTYPLIRRYAEKIGADFFIIDERRFPDWPVTYEKFQIFDLARQMGNDWNIYIDSDTLIHPDLMDITNHMTKDQVAHYDNDVAGNRWRYDECFLRDGRHIGSCNWFAVASDWCLDLWRPLDDISLEEALSNINPIVREENGLITRDHLIDDYVCSRNIARHGLKFTTVKKILHGFGYTLPGSFIWHMYNITEDQKLNGMEQLGPDGVTRSMLMGMKQILAAWGIPVA